MRTRRNNAEDANRRAKRLSEITHPHETQEQLINRLAPREQGGLAAKISEYEIFETLARRINPEVLGVAIAG